MTNHKPITGTFAKPDTQLPKHGRICRRCGIEYASPKGLLYCTDCRHLPRVLRNPTPTPQTT